MENQEPIGLTRRDALKRGAKLGGAVLWMTPVVQAIGMRPAFAQTTSVDACVRTAHFRAKSDEVDGWEDDPGFGARDCTNCAEAPGVDGTEFFTIEGDEDEVTVTLIPGTECTITAIWAKGGSGTDSCGPGVIAAGGQSATVGRPPNNQGISHVEVCFSCCEDDV